jgi:hypothetical protein
MAGRYREPPRLTRIKGSKYWHIIYHDGERDRRMSTGTTDRALAELELDKFNLRGIGSSEPNAPATPEVYTIGEAMSHYLKARYGFDPLNDPDGKLCKPGAVEALLRASCVQQRFKPDMPVIVVTTPSVEKYIADMQATPIKRGGKMYANATIAGHLDVLRAALKRAVRDGKLTHAPFIQSPPSTPGRDIWLDTWEFDLLSEECRSRHLKLFLELAVATGGRKGAILDLQWHRQLDGRGREVTGTA